MGKETMDGKSLRSGPDGISVSLFEHSAENHLKAMDSIADLCGEKKCDFDENEIQGLSSSIAFLREWRHYNYEPRAVRFSNESISDEKNDNCISLPQYSSATVPKEVLYDNTSSVGSSKDFVMYVGGSVWALDWCPRVHEKLDAQIKCEYLAVSAHPPESYHHKIGVPLTGRGIIQIWCILDINSDKNILPVPEKNLKCKSQRDRTTEKNLKCKSQRDRTTEGKTRGRPRKKPLDESLLAAEPKRPRGRPRKNPTEMAQPKKSRGRTRKKVIDESLDDLDGNAQYVQALAVEYPEELDVPLAIEGPSETIQETCVPSNKDKIKDSEKVASASYSTAKREWRESLRSKVSAKSSNSMLLDENEDENHTSHGLDSMARNQVEIEYSEKMASSSNSAVKLPIRRQRLTSKGGSESSNCMPSDGKEKGSYQSYGQDSMVVNDVSDSNCLEVRSHSFPGTKDIALPRLVLCLAHNGKVAWDMKWRPSGIDDLKKKQRMGYLAVLLGNGSLEVWEVLLPQTMKAIYLSSGNTGTDPRFVKLEPIFRCSKLKCGGTQSIPLTVEWSTSANPDFLLAGCHDGLVALWKFSPSKCSEDTRPLLCFSADTVPIRAVAWAPVESDPESANVIATAGHGGLKFWDIRDPYHPLWDIHLVPRFIYSLDWLPDPRCVILSFDDGTMRILSLVKAAYDGPATGKPFSGTKQQGFSVYNCSSFAVWNVQVSRLTGMVAYCSADSRVLRFQLTSRAVEKDSRYRAPHFLCGYLTMEDSTVTVHTPLQDNPLTLKKAVNESGEAPRCLRSLLTDSSQGKGANCNRQKNPVPDLKPVALTYGDDDLCFESEPEETLASNSSDRVPESKRKRRKKTEDADDQALVCIEEEQVDNQDNVKGKSGNEIGAFPPKMAAMHRVRWNMNRGSERWLCFGGAAGIVRCQEITVTDADKKKTRQGQEGVFCLRSAHSKII